MLRSLVGLSLFMFII